MKETVLLPIFTLVIGFAVGIFFRFSVLPSTSGTPTRSTMNAVSAPASAAPSLSVSLSPSLNTSSGLDPEDNGVLLERAGEVLEAMKSRDFAALSQMVHPDRGVTFTPVSYTHLIAFIVLYVQYCTHINICRFCNLILGETKFSSRTLYCVA